MRRMRHLKPREIQGCQLALDASIPTSLYDATSGGSLVAGDGAVARWEDQSGNARHATQGTSGNRPLRKVSAQGGVDAIRFDGIDDRLNHALGNQPGTTALTIAAVKWLNISQTSYRGIFSFGNSSTSGSMLLMRNSSLLLGSYSISLDISSTYVPTTTPFVCAQLENPTTSWFVNCAAYGTSSNAPGGQATKHVGGDSSGQCVNMDAYQISAWFLAPPQLVINRAMGAAMRKWRISG